MISFIKGIIFEKETPNLIINANGIGYEIQLPTTSFVDLPQIGSEIALYIHFVVREDGHFLYGFLDKNQRSLFRNLIKVNNIGPKLALAILSAMQPQVFVRNILNNDADSLEAIPGIGSKTAKRLIIDMRDKISEWEVFDSSTSTPSANAGVKSIAKDAISALIALGYKPQEAKQIILELGNEYNNLPSEELVRLALKKLH